MDKIIGLGNALVDVLATLKDDTLLDEMGLPKGSMQLIDDAKLQQINERFSRMKTHWQPVERLQIRSSDSLVWVPGPVLSEKSEMTLTETFFGQICKEMASKINY